MRVVVQVFGNLKHVKVRKSIIIIHWNYKNDRNVLHIHIDSDVCSVQDNCSTCTAKTECGWCDTRCVLGNSSAPFDQNIPCVQWFYDACAVNCSEYHSCSVCAGDLECAWCSTDSSQGSCYPKKGVQKYDDRKIDATCVTDTDFCPVEIPCEQYINCTQCVGDLFQACGWCRSSQTCLNRNSTEECVDYQENTCDGSYFILINL